MALPSTLHHLDVSLAHVDRGIERTFALKAARHPSETVERLWLRLAALLWQYEDGIAFGPGLCEPEAPDVLLLGPDGVTPALLVRVGKPEPERILRDLGRGRGARVAVLFESPRRMEAFLEEARSARMERLGAVDLAAIDPALLAGLAAEDGRRAKVSGTIVGDHLYLEVGGRALDGPLTRGAL